MLVSVIKKDGRLYCDNPITITFNKIKTTWRIVNLETRRKASISAIESLNTDGRNINTQQLIAGTFSKYFLSIADDVNIINNNTHTQKYNPNTDNINSSLQYMLQIYKSTYTKMKQKLTKTFEI